MLPLEQHLEIDFRQRTRLEDDALGIPVVAAADFLEGTLFDDHTRSFGRRHHAAQILPAASDSNPDQRPASGPQRLEDHVQAVEPLDLLLGSRSSTSARRSAQAAPPR